MPWFAVSSRFHSHPSVIGTKPEAIGLWVTAGSWLASHGKGDVVPVQLIETWKAADHAAELIRVGLWQRARGGYRMLANPRRWPHHEPLWTIQRDDYRRKIPDAVRQFVMERDGYQCVRCGTAEDLTLDHIYPWSRGGKDAAANLRVLCRPCNSSKGARV